MSEFTGIVLAGGFSSRMGRDKSMIEFNGNLLYERAANMLSPFVNQVCISINQTQKETYEYLFPTIVDKYRGQGPIGGILSCLEFTSLPLIILGCDLPLISEKDIEHLIQIRNQDQACSLFFNDQSLFFEPLLSIWELHSFSKLKSYYANGGRSLQKFINESQIERISMPDPNHFYNLNTLDDLRGL